MAFMETRDLNLDATELRLGLPGTTKDSENQTPPPPIAIAISNKRALPDMNDDHHGSCNDNSPASDAKKSATSTKTQVVGWPPVRSYRKNSFQAKKVESKEGAVIYVKVSMDGAPYLRKVDLNIYKGYSKLLKALEEMFRFKVGKYSEREGYNGSEFVPTYEDKDGDWMLVGDVPWEMFITSCKRLRIMKGSEARGLGCTV